MDKKILLISDEKYSNNNGVKERNNNKL